LLVLKAKEFWAKLLCYTRKKEPKFSIGWLNSFKKRYRIKERRRHKEGSSTQINKDSKHIIEEIRQAIKEYEHDLTYNIDKSGYY
jgi:hypothetical protein